MSLLPTTRIVSGSNSGLVEPMVPGQDEDILLVDFQPVVVANNQILSSPSTHSTAMYPIAHVPPGGVPLPGPHPHAIGVGMNSTPHPSISSDGITTPISATGSSGKAYNANNYSLVNLSNHQHHHGHHHNNNTSRDDSDTVSYHNNHHSTNSTNTTAVIQSSNLGYDEDDEFARHQALAQPSYMMNKRRSRRFVSRDNSYMWDNANHVGHQGQSHVMSSSLSSSEDSDTGFLMGTRKTAYTRRSVQRVVDPHPTSTTVGGNGSPSASTGLLPNLANKKRVRRKRPSARNRKPMNNQRDNKMPNPGDVLSFCCCLCDDDLASHSSRSSQSHASSIRNRYLRLACVIIVIIVIAVLTSITVSLQRKVDSLFWNLKKLDQAVGSPLSIDSNNNGATKFPKPSESFETLLKAHNELNATVTGFKIQLDQALTKIQDLQKQVNAAATKPDAVTELRGDLAKLGSRVQELSATIDKVKENVEQLKTTAIQNSSASNHTASELKSTNPTASST